jgi:hypothetical protein
LWPLPVDKSRELRGAELTRENIYCVISYNNCWSTPRYGGGHATLASLLGFTYRIHSGYSEALMRLVSSLVALAMSSSAVLAADVAPLSPGAPAGVKHAQDVGQGNMLLYIGLGAAAIAGIAIAASQDDNAAPTPAPGTTTTTTTTS